MAQLRPKSFLTGSEVDLGSVLSSYNARQFHHIYPKAYLAANGVAFHQANVISNICFLAASENNAISDKNPEDYFNDIPDSHKAEVFEAALIPDEAKNGDLPFEEFIKLRTEKLISVGQKLVDTGSL
jgi:hypothetical protein